MMIFIRICYNNIVYLWKLYNHKLYNFIILVDYNMYKVKLDTIQINKHNTAQGQGIKQCIN